MEIYHEKRENYSCTLWADIKENCFRMEGQSYSKDAPPADWYEWHYKIDETETKKFIKIIKEDNKTIEEAISEKFGNAEGSSNFRKLCEENNIEYETFTWF